LITWKFSPSASMICWSYCVQPSGSGEEGALVAGLRSGELAGDGGVGEAFGAGQGGVGVHHVLGRVPGDLADDAQLAAVLHHLLLVDVLGDAFAVTRRPDFEADVGVARGQRVPLRLLVQVDDLGLIAELAFQQVGRHLDVELRGGPGVGDEA
jgi:hypothetical protein